MILGIFYWPGLYNVKFVHNCSGSMLRADLTNVNQLPAGWLSHTPKTVLLSKVTLGINNFSVVWIENLSNLEHFHISAMSIIIESRRTMSFCELADFCHCNSSELSAII